MKAMSRSSKETRWRTDGRKQGKILSADSECTASSSNDGGYVPNEDLYINDDPVQASLHSSTPKSNSWRECHGSQQTSSWKPLSRTNSSQIESRNESNIRVVVRVRPLNASEIQRKDVSCLEYPEKSVLWVNVNGTTRPFTFNTILDDNISQVEVFDSCGIQDLIGKAVNGFSCTAFAFGQTGSGKTYTITGPFDFEASISLQNGSLFGLIPRSFEFLLSEVQKREENFVIKTAYLEVYNEKVKDLLNPSRARDSLPVRWSSTDGFYVDNVFMMECENLEDMMAVLDEGLQNRQVAAHAMNDHSSRSHTILIVYLYSETTDSDSDIPISKHGKISFVDLAGSERVKETRPNGDAFTESQNINKSLLTLGNCIAALGDPKKRTGHIPYRESKLTKLLADSLGGDGYTLMIACISPSSVTVQDTLNTLRYANRAKNIKNKPVIKMDPRDQMIISLRREVKLLKSENTYFRQQLNVPCSDSQIVLTPNQIKGEMSAEEDAGCLSPAIGTNTLSSLESSSRDSLSDVKYEEILPRANTATYAMNASIGLYDMLQEYMNENETLRQRNYELFKSRNDLEREHEILSIQNDSLMQKIGNIERVLSSTSMSSSSDDTIINNEEDKKEMNSSDGTSSFSKDQQLSFSLPPLRFGTYPNIISSPVDLAAEVEREHKKIKEERARIEKEMQKKDEETNKSTPDYDNLTSNLNNIPNKSNMEEDFKQIKLHTNAEAENRDLPINAIRKMEEKFEEKLDKSGVKLKEVRKISVTEREKGYSYAAKFAVRKGLQSKLPQKTKKGSADLNRTSHHHDSLPSELDGDETEKQMETNPLTESINERLRKDLEQLEGQIRDEVAFKQRNKQHYYK